MPEIKVQRDTKIILALSEEEARHLTGFLCSASATSNRVIDAIEMSLHEALEGGDTPSYDYDEDRGFFVPSREVR
jgi:hypothetical protein